MAQASSLSEVSPEMPTAPMMSPAGVLISTPPGLVTMRPSLAAASMVKNCGVLAARTASVRDPKPMPSAPQALPKAMSKRSRPDVSSRLNATRCPPASSTATVSGAQLVSRPFLSAVSTMVEACASVTDIGAPRLMRERRVRYCCGSRFRAVGPIDRDRRHFRRARDVSFGLFVAGQCLRDERQFDAAILALGQHGAQILDCAVDVEGHRPAVATAEHRGHARSAVATAGR